MDHRLEARALLEAHLGDADGMRLYSDRCRERQLGVASAPWSNLTIVTMTPQEFLSLAAPIFEEADLPEESLACIIEADKMASIGHGLKEGLSNMPHFHLDREGEDARVMMHEGRHRALTAAAMGIERFPVQLVMGENHDHGAWHLMTMPPVRLLGERSRHGVPGNECTALPMPMIPLTAQTLGLERDAAEEASMVARTVVRFLGAHDADPLDCPVTRAWAEEQGVDTLRWSEREERYEAALANLAEVKAAGPRP